MATIKTYPSIIRQRATTLIRKGRDTPIRTPRAHHSIAQPITARRLEMYQPMSAHQLRIIAADLGSLSTVCRFVNFCLTIVVLFYKAFRPKLKLDGKLRN